MTPPESQRNSIVGNTESPNVGVPWLTLSLPLLIAALIFFFSPNFRVIDETRTAPLGGDFLQEWIGATVLSGGQPARLYDTQYVDSMQHDPQVVGFEWPASSYFRWSIHHFIIQF